MLQLRGVQPQLGSKASADIAVRAWFEERAEALIVLAHVGLRRRRSFGYYRFKCDGELRFRPVDDQVRAGLESDLARHFQKKRRHRTAQVFVSRGDGEIWRNSPDEAINSLEDYLLDNPVWFNVLSDDGQTEGGFYSL